MIGRLLKELVVQTGRYVRYHVARTFGREAADVAPGNLPADTRPTAPAPANAAYAPTNLPSRPPMDAPPRPAGDSPAGLRLDLGCGPNKVEGYVGIDRRQFAGVDGITDLTKKRWLFQQSTIGGVQLVAATLDGVSGFELPDSSVAEVHCSHFLEHLDHNQARPERARFMNELWRVLIPGGKAEIITPHWASHRAYGDFTHADKPVSEMFYYYLSKDWRKTNAPDNDVEFNPDGYCCDFEFQLNRTVHPHILEMDKERVEFAATWYKDAIIDLEARLTARK